ncbi:MAG: hypothetical protein IKN50_01130 [Clostridia bacterium]|nr:hypothetical protein [Clostridia bacterium]MBR3639188.1 hypothetical protein [Clostridia bacterium]
MTASKILFVAYLAAGVALAVWGVKGGKKTVVYPVIEGALSVLGIAAALVIYFSFGRLPGRTVENAERLEYAAESFSVFAKVILIICAVVVVLCGLRLLLRLIDTEKTGVWGIALDVATPLVGSAVIFLFTVALYSVFYDITSSFGFEITAFALSAALGLRFLLALGALLGKREEKKQG